MQKSKLLLLFYLITTAQLSFAQHYSDKPSLEQLAGDAELIFQGTLTDLQYRDSADGIPHTFVTYKVEEVVKGLYDNPAITLRFVGGYKDNGRSDVRLIVSHAPKFSPNEKGIMMVGGDNGASGSICPLVACDKGRFTLKGAYVTDVDGAVMSTDRSGKLTYLSQAQAKGAQDSTPMTRDSFIAHLRNIVASQKSLSSPATNKGRPSVYSADPHVPFVGPQAKAEGPPREEPASSVPKIPQAKGKSDFDRWEAEQLRLNGGNPVLPANRSGE